MRHLFRCALIPAVLLCLFTHGCRKHAVVHTPATPHHEGSPSKAAPPPELAPAPPPPPVPSPPPAESRAQQQQQQQQREPQPEAPSAAAPRPFEAPSRAIGAVRDSPPHRYATAGRTASAIPPPAQPVTDASRPRKIVLKLVPGLSRDTGAFKLDSPPLRQGNSARFRLLVDPQPTFAESDDDYARTRAQPGFTDGVATTLSPVMEAQISGPGLNVSAEDSIRKDIDPKRAAEWFWDVTPSQPGMASVRLDLTAIINGEKRQFDPFPVHVDQPVAAARTPAPQPATGTGISPWWLLALLPPILLAAWYFLRRRAADSRTPAIAPLTDSVASRAVLHRSDGYVFVMDVLVVCNPDEQARVQDFCRQLADERYKFDFGLPGFAASSSRWQENFSASLETCDAVLVGLTTNSLGEKWVNWQLEKATVAQKEHDIPIYVAALDERVMKVSRTIGFLEGLRTYPPTPEGQSELKALLKDSEPASTRNIRCFISYSHQHRDFADKLCTDLNHAGIRTWMDVDGIPGGSAWKQKIAEAIDSSTHVLFVLTAESAKSDQVSDEIDWARQKKKTIIPVMEIETDLPFGLLGTQFVSFTQGYDVGFTRLLKDLSLSGSVRKKSSI